jgi:hypothetical protein
MNVPAPSRVRVHIPDVWRSAGGKHHVPLAAFLLGTQRRNHMGTWRDTFCHEMDFGDSCIFADRLGEADFILFPFAWDSAVAEQLAEENRQVDLLSREADCPVICHGFTNDVLDPESVRLPFANGVYLSATLVRSRRPVHSFGFSYFIPDCREKHAAGPLVIPKPEKPSVGFCGVAAPYGASPGKTRLFDCLRLGLTCATAPGIDPEWITRRLGTNTKHAYRARLIHQFRKRPEIDCDFILRSVGGLVDNSYTNKADGDTYNTGFYQNLEQNLYTICCRGTENYSVRFYETLCMGRIPVVVDTDLVLPFDDTLDYSQHCVWISKRDIARAADILLQFHHGHSENELAALQRANRTLWETCLSHKTYYAQLVRTLSGKESA